MQYNLIPATSADEAWLENLRRDVYADLFNATWGAWDEARHARHFAACLERGQIQIIAIAGEPVGMVQIFNDSDALEVGEIQIEPAHQHRGIGTRILMDIVSAAHKAGKAVRLSVGLQNHKALRLYERLGFQLLTQSETHTHLEYKA
ncbi:MAG: hypothetical protein CVV27_01470 [Candidatus Melainabacteria bacterium HGW-Melainabacteria-1]|nr:MAG: hypothetical protein CVV27_01470 [Candidatus Melainabacteria bacterium HGW-Melainabacteria-1]